MGEELGGLGVKELQRLENQLEMSLRAVRTKKVKVHDDEYFNNQTSSCR